MSTLFVNNLNTASGSTITVPTGKKLVVTDGGGVTAPGMVVQVQQSTASANLNTASTSYVQGPTTSTFTMKDSSNKVLVTFNVLIKTTTSGTYNGARIALYRGDVASGTKITSGTEPQLLSYSDEIWAWQTLQFLDTPGASSVTYSLGINRHSSASSAQIMGSYGNTVMMLQEIAT